MWGLTSGRRRGIETIQLGPAGSFASLAGITSLQLQQTAAGHRRPFSWAWLAASLALPELQALLQRFEGSVCIYAWQCWLP